MRIWKVIKQDGALFGLAAMMLVMFGVIGLLWAIYSVPGCGILENTAGRAVSDIDGWDLSACVESSAGRKTCWELFTDNWDEFQGGQPAVEAALDGLDIDTNGTSSE